MMGMGEPLLNLNQVMRAIRLINLPEGPAIGGRRITVSTAGHVPGIRKLARADLNVGLAISLNATTDELRQEIMPINRRYPLAELLEAAEEFYEHRGRRVTFEYVLMEGITDDDGDALRLAALSKRFPCKVNLIPYNELGSASPFRRPPRQKVARFHQLVESNTWAAVTVRESRGRDINAACGQLFQESETAGGKRLRSDEQRSESADVPAI
jgi:23S rRNA (adenine2503-C2)-methyltransferase